MRTSRRNCARRSSRWGAKEDRAGIKFPSRGIAILRRWELSTLNVGPRCERTPNFGRKRDAGFADEVARRLILTLPPAFSTIPEATMIRLENSQLDVLPAPLHRPWVRSRDRRTAVARLLTSLAQHVRAGHETPTLRARFEAGLREALRVPAVRLREHPPPYLAALPTGADAPRRACVDVPTRHGSPRVVLEATLDSEMVFDAWDTQLLMVAAQLAALVIELDRRRSSQPRFSSVGLRRDSSTPSLVGTS